MPANTRPSLANLLPLRENVAAKRPDEGLKTLSG